MTSPSQRFLHPPTSPSLNEPLFLITNSPTRTHVDFHNDISVRFDEHNETFIKDESLKGVISNLHTTSESILKMVWETKTTSLQQSATTNISINQLTDQIKALKSLLIKLTGETSLSTKDLKTMTQSIVGVDDRVSGMLKGMKARLLQSLQENVDHSIKLSEILIDRRLQESIDQVKGLLLSYDSHLESLNGKIQDLSSRIKDVQQVDVDTKASEISELQSQVSKMATGYIEMRGLIQQLSLESSVGRRLNDDRLRQERIQFQESLTLQTNTLIGLFKDTIHKQPKEDNIGRNENIDPRPTTSKRPATPKVVIKSSHRSSPVFTPERPALQPMTSLCNMDVSEEPSQKSSNSQTQNGTSETPAPPSISGSRKTTSEPGVPASNTAPSLNNPNIPRICNKPPTIKVSVTSKPSK